MSRKSSFPQSIKSVPHDLTPNNFRHQNARGGGAAGSSMPSSFNRVSMRPMVLSPRFDARDSARQL
jgi:hypothetical protein